MSSRYYFLSSMSMLRFSDKAPISWESFLNQAKGNVSESEYEALCSIDDRTESPNKFLSEWNELNRKLDEAVNVGRRKNLNREEKASAVFVDYEISKTANAALNAKDPLEAEMVLMRFRYDWLEAQKGLDPFSEAALYAYALQLRILIRKDLFTVEAGNEQFSSMFDSIQKELDME